MSLFTYSFTGKISSGSTIWGRIHKGSKQLWNYSIEYSAPNAIPDTNDVLIIELNPGQVNTITTIIMDPKHPFAIQKMMSQKC